MNKKMVVIIVLVATLAAAVLIILLQKPIQEVVKVRISNNISKVVPTQIDMVTGTIEAFNNSILSVKQDGVKNYNIAKTDDIQAVVAGSVGGNDAVTVKTVKSDLVIGKEVVIFFEKGSNTVRSVYILK